MLSFNMLYLKTGFNLDDLQMYFNDFKVSGYSLNILHCPIFQMLHECA